MPGGCMARSFTTINAITEYLYIGPASAVHYDKLVSHGITCVINVSLEKPPCDLKDIEYIRIEVQDALDADLKSYFDFAADKVEQVRLKKGKTLIHCIAGASRSATLCIAYLMKYKKMTLREAFKTVKSARPIVKPNNNFFCQLIEYEKELFGKATVRMVPLTDKDDGFFIPDIFREECKGIVWLRSIKRALIKS